MIHLYLPKSGLHEGDMRLANDLEFHGRVTGSVTVPAGRRLRFHGNISGDLIVQRNAQAAVYGSIAGAVLNHGAAVNILGMAGSVRNMGETATVLNDRAVGEKPVQGPAEPAIIAPVVKLPPARRARQGRK
ncbi:MAG TPA: hypothetical protein VG821_04005 [Rhizomicrobium sp.]|nr:hypothetical protein [Rhizomicrobium sp.]